jgi:hypothetical protein
LYNALIRNDPHERFRLVLRIARWLRPDYRFKWPHMQWWEDAYFNAHLSRFGELDELNTDRRWMMYQLQRLTTALDGATAECGVYKGASSFQIAEVNRKLGGGRTHYAFDSFSGLSTPTDQDGDYWEEGDLSVPLAEFEKNLAPYKDKVVVHRGWIPECFADVPDEQFAFVHIDVDLYEPTLASLEFFYPRMVPGGIILCDDYGLTTCPGATRAFDEFTTDKPEKVIAASGGAGFIVAGVTTARALDAT